MMMARTRLTQNARSVLNGLARKLITTPVETQALKDAYAVALSGVIAAVELSYLQKDMKILARYEVAFRDTCIKLQADGRYVRQFIINSDAEASLVPRRNGCSARVYLVEDAVWESIGIWETAKKTADTARNQKRADYEGLIAASRFFEDVVEVWPEAEQLRTQICGQRTALSIVSPDLVSRIRADVAGRAA